MMEKRKRLTKQQREDVYNKYGGRCAYCGEKINFEDMQVDHVNSYYRNDGPRGHKLTDEEMNDPKNLLPACRMCNFYKGTSTLEEFRERLQCDLTNNAMRQFATRLAVRYHLLTLNLIRPFKFYFEKEEEKTEQLKRDFEMMMKRNRS